MSLGYSSPACQQDVQAQKSCSSGKYDHVPIPCHLLGSLTITQMAALTLQCSQQHCQLLSSAGLRSLPAESCDIPSIMLIFNTSVEPGKAGWKGFNSLICILVQEKALPLLWSPCDFEFGGWVLASPIPKTFHQWTRGFAVCSGPHCS